MSWSTLDIISAAGKCIFTAFVVRCLIVYAYRVTIHPLSKYPGPILASVTDWYVVGPALLKRLHLVTFRDHQKYGPVIRHGPNKLVFNTIGALNDIYQNDRTNKVSSYLATRLRPDVPTIFSSLDKDLHRTKRRMMSKALSEQKMRHFERILLSHVDVFLKVLLRASQAGKPANMSDRCKRLGLEIMGKFSFGYDLKVQTEETNSFIVKGLEGGSYRNNIYIQAPGVRWLGVEFMFKILFLRLFKLRMQYYYWLKGVVKQRLTEGKEAREDFFSYVVDAKDPEIGTTMSITELCSEATFFFPAGGDTTATTLTAAFFYLSRNPESYSKLVSEVRSKFSSGAEIQTGQQLSSCHYLRAVIDESMRLSPPVAGTLWRELPLGKGGSIDSLIVDGHVVPAGTWVGVNTYTIHHNEEYFPEPFAFKPERWIPENAEKQPERMRDAFIPFGVGARSCAGKNMAYMEASLVLAKTLWYFDFERCPDSKLDKVGGGHVGDTNGRHRADEFQLHDGFIAGHDGPYLVFKPREGVSKDLQ